MFVHCVTNFPRGMSSLKYPEFCYLCEGSLIVPTFGTETKFPVTHCASCFEVESLYITAITGKNSEACHYQHLPCLRMYVKFFDSWFGMPVISCPGVGCASQFLGVAMVDWMTLSNYRLYYNSQFSQ